eukprot:TRINITY_DN7891_c0_g1_i1.p1 TRINITY_DN7891_c0_g1~~TRINITY_DN7891_c0_g1_i1.p1  ORF type:complete len:136 (+),score=21.81 TRINITY_DN7891_c0_g1_i1:188-595(+)
MKYEFGHDCHIPFNLHKSYPEQIPSKQIFHFFRRLTGGPKRSYYHLTLALILIPTLLFWSFVIPYICINLTPALAAIVGIIEVLMFSGMFACAYRDAGVIPRKPKHSDLRKQGKNNIKVTLKAEQIQLRFCRNYY